MKVLIVGAGAVGVVYGYHVVQGGGEVTFLVKPKYAEELRKKPLVVQRLGRGSRPVLFDSYRVVQRLEDLGKGDYDVALLAVASTALRDTTWLRQFLRALPEHTLVVCLGSGLEDRRLVLGAGCPLDRLVQGFITFSAWQAPLPGEKVHVVPQQLPWPNTHPAVAYSTYGPLPLPFAGEPLHVEPLARTLTQGGMRAMRVPTWLYDPIFLLPAVIMPLLLGLEAEGWSFRRLAKGHVVKEVTGGIWEALVITADRLDLWWIGLVRFFFWTLFLRVVLLLAPLLSPYDVEAFFRYHFTKVGAQTLLFVDDYVNDAATRKISATNLIRLRARNPRWKEQHGAKQ